jgi:hypothetical protein
MSKIIAPNAYRYMTLGAGYRALRSNDPCPQCAGAEPHKGRQPDCGYAETEPPTGGEAYTGLLGEVRAVL